MGNTLRFPDECARHKILDMVGDLALLGLTSTGSWWPIDRAIKPTTPSCDGCSSKLDDRLGDSGEPAGAIAENGVIDIAGIMSLLPHRYPFLLVDRVLETQSGPTRPWRSRT